MLTKLPPLKLYKFPLNPGWKKTTNVLLDQTAMHQAFSHMGRRLRQRTLGHMRTAKMQTRLRIRAVWSESSLFAYIIKGSC